MKDKMIRILEQIHRYNSDRMTTHAFGLDPDTEYDALVVAPSYTPYKLKMDEHCKVTTLKEGSYIAGYLVEKDGLKIAWIKIASSDSNLIDHIAICAELKFRKMIFIGAVGAPKPGYVPGDICTPSCSVAGGFAHTYLKDSIRDYVPFERIEPADIRFVDRVIEAGRAKGYEIRKASVFCTPSIALEYSHLEEIKAFDTDLIEMETASFYLMADLLEVDSTALLVVSDNSATGSALVGRSEEDKIRYEKGFREILPDMIYYMSKRKPRSAASCFFENA